MTYCSIQASLTLLIELEYILSEVVAVRASCFSIAQHTPTWEREPRSLSHKFGPAVRLC
jgi:hypothetical protein